MDPGLDQCTMNPLLSQFSNGWSFATSHSSTFYSEVPEGYGCLITVSGNPTTTLLWYGGRDRVVRSDRG